jgi:hypothetical protein
MQRAALCLRAVDLVAQHPASRGAMRDHATAARAVDGASGDVEDRDGILDLESFGHGTYGIK